MLKKESHLYLWSLRIVIGILLFSFITIFLYYRAYLPKPFIPMDSPFIRYVVCPSLLVVAHIINWRKKKKKQKENTLGDEPQKKDKAKEEEIGKEKERMGIFQRIMYRVIVPAYLLTWIRIYRFQNLLFKLFPTFFKTIMYFSHRLFWEYMREWRILGESSKRYNLFYALVCGRVCTYVLYLFLFIDIFIYKGLHMVFYAFVFKFIYFHLFDYLLFMASRYEDLFYCPSSENNNNI